MTTLDPRWAGYFPGQPRCDWSPDGIGHAQCVLVDKHDGDHSTNATEAAITDAERAEWLTSLSSIERSVDYRNMHDLHFTAPVLERLAKAMPRILASELALHEERDRLRAALQNTLTAWEHLHYTPWDRIAELRAEFGLGVGDADT